MSAETEVLYESENLHCSRIPLVARRQTRLRCRPDSDQWSTWRPISPLRHKVSLNRRVRTRRAATMVTLRVHTHLLG